MSSSKSATSVIEKIERVLGRITASVLLTILLLIISDWLVGVTLNSLYKTSDNLFPRDIYFEPHPYTMYGGTYEPALQQEANLNAAGYRGPLPIQPKPNSEYRIAMIGGSTVLYGNPTLTELLESNFHKKGYPEVRVYNFGVAASILRMDLARLVFEVGNYSPDLVIFYGGGNDIGMPYQSDPRPGYPPNFLAYEYNPLIRAGTERQQLSVLFKLALLHSRTVRTLAGKQLRESIVSIDQIRKQQAWNTAPWSRAIAQTYLSDIKRADQIAETFKAKALFIFQPILEFKRHTAASEQALKDPNFKAHAALSRSLIVEGLMQLKRENAIQYTDISSIFDSTEAEVFVDGIHIHQEYQADVAKAIFDALEKSNFAPWSK